MDGSVNLEAASSHRHVHNPFTFIYSPKTTNCTVGVEHDFNVLFHSVFIYFDKFYCDFLWMRPVLYRIGEGEVLLYLSKRSVAP